VNIQLNFVTEYRILSKVDETRMSEVDRGLKNKFIWSWTEKEITVSVVVNNNTSERTFKLSEFITKVDIPGKALCTLCQSLITYSSKGGGGSLMEHCKSKKHFEKMKPLFWEISHSHNLSMSLTFW